MSGILQKYFSFQYFTSTWRKIQEFLKQDEEFEKLLEKEFLPVFLTIGFYPILRGRLKYLTVLFMVAFGFLDIFHSYLAISTLFHVAPLDTEAALMISSILTQTALPFPYILLIYRKKLIFELYVSEVYSKISHNYEVDPESQFSRGMKLLKVVFASLALVTVAGITTLLSFNGYFNSRYSRPAEGISDLHLTLDLPYALSYPFDLNNHPVYWYMAYGGQLLTICFAGYTVLVVGYFGIMLLLGLLTHVQSVIDSVNNIKDATWATFVQYRSHDKSFKQTDKNMELCLELCFKRVIMKYQDVRRWEKLYRGITGEAVGFIFLFLTISIGLNLFTIVNTEHRYPGWSNYSTIFLVGELLGMAIACILGQTLVNMSEELVFSVYCTEWYSWPERLTSDLLVLQELLKRPLEMKIIGIFNVRLTTYKDVVIILPLKAIL